MIELIEMVLSLFEFCAKLVEFGSSESRWRVLVGEMFAIKDWFLKWNSFFIVLVGKQLSFE